MTKLYKRVRSDWLIHLIDLPVGCTLTSVCFPFFPHETKDVESLNVIKETVSVQRAACSVQRATMVMIHINKELYTSLGGSMGIF